MGTPKSPQEKRVEEIQKLQPTQERIKIDYKDVYDLYPVYEIPLEYLIYNPHNGRIRSLTKSFESQYHQLNPEDPDDITIIEHYLFDSSIDRNEKTQESIELIGQREVGIVTKDGVIIDGNRRALILKRINDNNEKFLGTEQHVEKRKFRAIVLKDSLSDNRSEILRLETRYQLGVDSKVEYNPIEKYIRCKELLESYSETEVAHEMGVKLPKIQVWVEILNLMEEYLDKSGTKGLYTRLEKKEGHFVDLHRYLKTYSASAKAQSVDWNYSIEDVNDVKFAYFTYIRLGIPVSNARIIANPAKSKSIFCHGNLWKEFITEIKNINKEYKEESFEKLKNNIEEESFIELGRMRDNKWGQMVGPALENSLSLFRRKLEDKASMEEPLILLKRAKSTIWEIDISKLKNLGHSTTKTLLNDLKTRIQQIIDSISTQ